jgi:tetratricopeptide (TPR) repeat protein
MARLRPRALGAAAVVAAAVLAGAVASPVGRAQPAPAAPDRSPDLERALELYRAAETAMADGRFDEAARDYGAAYELSRDAALLFKIGRANERAGRCDVALGYYERYLRDGKPAEPFVATTRERIRACGGDAGDAAGGAVTTEPRPGGDPGSAAAPGAGGSAAAPDGASAGSGSATAPDAAPTGSAAGASTGSAAPPPPILVPTNRHKIAWVMTGAAAGLAALGSVLAYAANSSENDLRDLYVGFAGQPATFSVETRVKYDNLVDQGRRFQHLSWVAFGFAGAAAVGAAVLFVVGGRDDSAQRARITPIVTPSSAGVAVGF